MTQFGKYEPCSGPVWLSAAALSRWSISRKWRVRRTTPASIFRQLLDIRTVAEAERRSWLKVDAGPATALWDLTPLFQLYGGQKTNFLIWTVLGDIITVLTCIWLVRTASSLRLAETNSEDPFFFSEVLAQIWWQEWISGWLNYQFEYHCISVW